MLQSNGGSETMKIGVCAGPDDARMLAEAGADYIECGVVGTLMPLADDSAWLKMRSALLTSPLPLETFNLFLPGDFRLVGEPSEVTDPTVIRRYVFTALRRARDVSGSLIVFGSGGARRVPASFPRDTAADQIRSFLSVCAEASDETGVVIAIEPLNTAECNIINTVSEAVREYVAVLNHPGIRVLADTYHMERENEPITAIATYATFLAHVHTADTNRVPPGQGEYDHATLFDLLRRIGYAGRVSVEARFTNLAGEIGAVMSHLRAAQKKAAG